MTTPYQVGDAVCPLSHFSQVGIVAHVNTSRDNGFWPAHNNTDPPERKALGYLIVRCPDHTEEEFAPNPRLRKLQDVIDEHQRMIDSHTKAIANARAITGIADAPERKAQETRA